ncbi:DUF6508 domain-containing protein [Nocardia stercoris]|uniref:Uncharacterized protein n=1 Tax=Nocardia stercoris TaxID=2483361 RepID=A0A3M2L157_9NOCA|nr:DUF6508 domain-containing protein [Nocardia stercoris]RMI31432.1 hypothetical protein EBN03_18995 [Nocardia stercoris]
MEPSDSDIEQQMLGAQPEHWQLLWSAVDDLLDEQPSPWETRMTNADGSLCMPYAVYSDAVMRVQQGLFLVNSLVKFDWPKWEGVRNYQDGRALAGAPVADACRMLTAITRCERHRDGTIGRALDDGRFQAAVLCLRRWYDDTADLRDRHVSAPSGRSRLSRWIGNLRTR